MAKIGKNGEYLPFWGFTNVSFCSEFQSYKLKKIEKYLKNSILAKYYTALPYCTYHMTHYNIWSQGKEYPEKLQHTIFEEPEEVFFEYNREARNYCKGTVKYTCMPKDIHAKGIICVPLELGEEATRQHLDIRAKMIDIYGHTDATLRPHLTLAYMYRGVQKEDENEVKNALIELNSLVQSQMKNIQFEKADVYTFESMTRYIPWVPSQECFETSLTPIDH